MSLILALGVLLCWAGALPGDGLWGHLPLEPPDRMQPGKRQAPVPDWATFPACCAAWGTRRFCRAGWFLVRQGNGSPHSPTSYLETPELITTWPCPCAPALLAGPEGETTSLNHSPRFP